MELKNLSWIGQFLVFMIIGVILFALFYFIHYSPTNDEIKNIIERSEMVQQEINLARSKEEELKKIKEINEKNRIELENLKAILPSYQEVAVILKNIQSLANNTRLKMKVFTPSQEVEKEIYKEWPIKISVDGNYHNLALFLDQVSRIKKIFNIDLLNISSSTTYGANPDMTISADLTATTYIYKEGAVLIKPVTKPQRQRGGREEGSENLKGEI